MALNKAIMQGRLTADPEMRKTQSGKDLTTFNIAVNRNYKDQSGNYPTDFFKVLANSHNAEFVCKYFRKGDDIIIVGSLCSDKYEDKNGNKRTDIYIKTDEVFFGAKKERAVETDYVESHAADFEEIDEEGLPF